MSNEEKWWAKTRALALATLLALAIFGYLLHAFAARLNQIEILGFPLGYYMAAQGSLILFVGLVFLIAARLDAIDRRHGTAETE